MTTVGEIRDLDDMGGVEVERCPECGEAQGAFGYCVVEGDIHSRYESSFVVPRDPFALAVAS